MFAYLKEYPHLPGSLLQNELNSDIARFTADKNKPYNLYICCKTGSKVGAGKTG